MNPDNCESVVIDCGRCVVRNAGVCADCVVTAVLAEPSHLSFDADEMAALDALADSGLVAPLRLVLPIESTSHAEAG